MKKYVFVYLFSLVSFLVKSQIANVTIPSVDNDSLYVASKYGDYGFALTEYIRNNIFPVLLSCKDCNDDEILLSYVALYISENGNVESVSLKRFNISKECEDILTNAFMNMGEWMPASYNGVSVKSRLLIKFEY